MSVLPKLILRRWAAFRLVGWPRNMRDSCINKQSGLEHFVTKSHILVMTRKRTANLLGALALGLGDQMKQATEQRLGQGGETSAALTTIGHVPGLSLDML